MVVVTVSSYYCTIISHEFTVEQHQRYYNQEDGEGEVLS